MVSFESKYNCQYNISSLVQETAYFSTTENFLKDGDVVVVIVM
jgi:hypothetical protein